MAAFIKKRTIRILFTHDAFSSVDVQADIFHAALIRFWICFSD